MIVTISTKSKIMHKFTLCILLMLVLVPEYGYSGDSVKGVIKQYVNDLDPNTVNKVILG